MKNKKAQIISASAVSAENSVKLIKDQLYIENLEALIFFCSSNYDLQELSFELNTNFDCQIIGCTTAGEITNHYLSNSLVVLALSSEAFVVHSGVIKDIQAFNLPKAMKLASDIELKLENSYHYSSSQIFGFLLTDGLSLKEEQVISSLSHAFGEIPILGGSAGDDLQFNHTYTYHNGNFHVNSAVIAVIEVLEDFEIFKIQHFIPTEKELVTTEVDFENRIVKEINGMPAALAYSEINGLDSNSMTDVDFAMNPLMLNIANEWYIRSISNVNKDNSLQFYCAIDYGLPLNVAKGTDIVQKLEEEVIKIENEFETIDFTLGCDCIHRRLEILQKGFEKEIESLLGRINFIGFNSYGEQYNGIHVNQTLVGVVVGKKKNGK